MATPECVWPLGAGTGEGPLWDAANNAVWFVDIPASRVHRYDVVHGTGTTWQAPSAPGFIVAGANGFVCGLKTGLHRFDPASGRFTLLHTVEPTLPGNRLNDACVDAKGRLWFGSMDDAEAAASGQFYRLASSGAVAFDGSYVVTNGPAVSPDARMIYFVDTFGATVYCADIADDGSVSGKRAFVHIDTPGAWPDGPTVDADGCLWLGLWGGWCINRYSPAGDLLETHRLPCANITKAAFGDSDLRTLYITTARKGLTSEQLMEQPLAGGLFALRVTARGMPQHKLSVGV